MLLSERILLLQQPILADTYTALCAAGFTDTEALSIVASIADTLQAAQDAIHTVDRTVS